jgi:hypothetical protein
VTRTGSLHDRLGDRWTYALLGGVPSIPFTTLAYWQSGSEMSLWPVFFGGLLAGYLAQRRTGQCSGVGLRAGLVGGLAIGWILADGLAAASALSGPTWFVVTALVITVVVLGVLGIGLAALAGAVGGRVGGWLAGRVDDRRPTTADR